MSLALALAREAAAAGEVPVGCVITGPDGTVIGQGRNLREETGDASAHAELIAIRQACAHLGDWRLEGCTLYVTGSCGSVLNLFEERYGHHPAIYGGVLREECTEVLQSFFQTVRTVKLPKKS